MSGDEQHVRNAIWFAHEACKRSTAPDDAVEHMLQVGDLLSGLGCSADVVIAAELHDVVEDGCASGEEVRARFGERVGALVAALSGDAEIADYAQRKRALRESVGEAGSGALVVFAADTLARLRTADRENHALGPARLQHYFRSLELLLISGIRTPHVDELARRLNARRVARRALPAGPLGP